MAKKRRSYTREFKIEAVKLITGQDYAVVEAARSWPTDNCTLPYTLLPE